MKKGSKHSNETRKRMSEAQKGKRLSEETRKRISEAKGGQPAPNKGVQMSDTQKKKISKANMGKQRSDETRKKLSESHKNPSDETRKRMSEAKRGQPSPNKGVQMSATQKKKISDAKKGKSSNRKGAILSKKQRQNMSAGHQGVPYDEWEAFACEKKYCPKFNEACRESNREKYGRRCFICNKTEKANGQKLSVHHVDMDRAQGCESNWKLVPLCKSCHAKAHNNELVARLGYILKEEFTRQ